MMKTLLSALFWYLLIAQAVAQLPTRGVWRALDNGLDAPVFCFAADGDTLYAGLSISYDRGAIVRWNGAHWDTLTNFYSGDHTLIYDLAFYKGKIFLGGYFRHVEEQWDTKCIAAWSPQTGWRSVGSYIDANAVPAIHDMLVWKNELYVTGNFKSLGRTDIPGVAVYDGFFWRPLGEGLTSGGSRMAVFQDELYVFGVQGVIDGAPVQGVARWDGTRWRHAGAGLSGEFFGVKAVTVHQGKLVAAGQFDRSGELPLKNLAQWDGAQWTPITHPRLNDSLDITSLASFGELLLLGGNDNYYRSDDPAAENVVLYDGERCYRAGAGLDSRLTSIINFKGRPVAGGFFAASGGRPLARVAELTDWSAMPPAALDRNFHVYPTLTEDEVAIMTPGRGSLRLYDMEGRRLGNWPAEGTQRLSLGGFPAGVYVLTYTDAAGNAMRKRILLR